MNKLTNLFKATKQKLLLTVLLFSAACNAANAQNPGGVAGAAVWLRSDAGVYNAASTDITNTGGTIAKWTNQMNGSNNYLAQTGTVTQNVSTALWNFNPTATFPGGAAGAGNLASQISVPTANGQDYTKFAPYKFNGGNTFRQHIESSFATLAGNNNWAFRTGETASNPAQFGIEHNSLGFVAQTASTNVYDNYLIGTARMARTIANGTWVNLNGFSNTPNTVSASCNAQRSVLGGLYAAGGNGANGSIPEFIDYTSALTVQQILQVESYLAIKYGITLTRDNNGNGTPGQAVTGYTEGDYLASDGTTKQWNSNATYQYNIAGIGRDDNTALLQKQSQSINAGSQVAMALGTVATTNQLNAGSIPTDKQFFVWGDDNGALSAATATGLVAAPNRLTRVWKTQNTNTFAQQITIYFPVTNFVSPYLIYGPSAASLGNGTATLIANSGTTSINSDGKVYWAFAVPAANIGNVNFFSFAGVLPSPGGVTGAYLWTKADLGVNTTGANVSSWINQGTAAMTTEASKTANANVTLTQASINFNPALTYTGANNEILAGTFVTAPNSVNGQLIFGAARQSSTAPYSAIYSNRIEAAQGLATGTGTYFLDGNGAACSVTGSFAGIPVISKANYVVNTTETGGWTGINGFKNPTCVGGAINQAVNGSFQIGGRTGNELTGPHPDRVFRGDIGEAIMYNGSNAVSIQQNVQIESYLAIKYGITLSRDYNGNGTSGEAVSGQAIAYNEGDYIAADGATITWTSNATYHNNIAGIGRDDATALLQKESQSINAGSQVAMALGTVATTNVGNAGSIPTDKQFFIWGDDNGSITGTTATGLAAAPYRLIRVWKTQNTAAFAQQVTVYYPVNVFSTPFGTAASSAVNLIYGSSAASLSNGTGTVIANSGTASINGASYYAFTVPAGTISALNYFSFTTIIIPAPGGVSNHQLWLKADGGVGNYTYTVANVPLANRSQIDNPYGLTNTTMAAATGNTSSGTVSSSANSWFQLDMGSITTVAGIISQGRGDNPQCVNSFTIQASTDGVSFSPVGGFYNANVDQNTLVVNAFPVPITTRYIRLYLAGWNAYPSIRFDALTSITLNAPTDGTVVKTWVNQTATADVFSATTGATWRNSGANQVNYNPVVVFNATLANSFLMGWPTGTIVNGFFGNNAAGTNAMFNFSKTTGSGGNANPSIIWSGLASSNPRLNWHSLMSAVGYHVGNSPTGAVTFNNTGANETQNYNLWSGRAGSLESVNHEVLLNGGRVASTANALVPFDVTTYNTSIGYQPDGSLWGGNLPELISYPADLSALNRKQVESYLAIKYGTTLSNNDNANGSINEVVSGAVREGDYVASDGSTITWASNATGVAGSTTPYHHNVTGIGRDDATALYQKQSTSINAVSNKVTMSLGTLQTTNAGNSNTFATDKSFIVWGDDNLSATTTQTTNLPSGISSCAERVKRSWRVQRTGTSPAGVQVIVDLTGLVATAGAISGISAPNLELVIDENGDGNFSSTYRAYTATSNVSGVLTFDNVQWDTDGSGSDVFTIVVNKLSYAPPPQLVANATTVLAPKATCTNNSGYLQFVNSVATPTIKYMAILPSTGAVYNFGTGITALNNSPAINNHTVSTGGVGNAYATSLANRMYTVPAGSATSGTYTVRIYYTPADTIAANNAALAAAQALDPAAIDKLGKWFKYESASVPAIIAAQVGTFVGFGSGTFTFLTPSAVGVESGVNYVEFSGITSFSTFGYMGAAGSPGTFPLPVSLVSFTATAGNCNATLNWQTANEINSKNYIVQQSADGLNFVQAASVASKNDANGASYSYKVNSLLAGINYFRLKAIDADGKFTYSSIITIRSNCKGSISITPNPTSDIINIAGLQGKNSIQIFNAIGQKMTEVQSVDFVTQISLSKFAKGVYVLRIVDAQGIVTNAKVVKE